MTTIMIITVTLDPLVVTPGSGTAVVDTLETTEYVIRLIETVEFGRVDKLSEGTDEADEVENEAIVTEEDDEATKLVGVVEVANGVVIVNSEEEDDNCDASAWPEEDSVELGVRVLELLVGHAHTLLLLVVATSACLFRRLRLVPNHRVFLILLTGTFGRKQLACALTG